MLYLCFIYLNLFQAGSVFGRGEETDVKCEHRQLVLHRVAARDSWMYRSLFEFYKSRRDVQQKELCGVSAHGPFVRFLIESDQHIPGATFCGEDSVLCGSGIIKLRGKAVRTWVRNT